MIDAAGLPAFVRLLQSADKMRSGIAAAALNGMLMHQEAVLPAIEAGVLPALVGLVQSESETCRHVCIACLSLIAAGPEAAKRAIIDCDLLPTLAGMPGGAQEKEGQAGLRILEEVRSLPAMASLAARSTVPDLLAAVAAVQQGGGEFERAGALFIILQYVGASTRMRDDVVKAGAVPVIVKLLSPCNTSVS